MRDSIRIALWLVGALCAFVTLQSSGSRQEGVESIVRGSVRSTTGAALEGAVVRVEGRVEHALSDAQGHYSLRVPKGEWRLECSYVGYQTAVQTVAAAAESQRCDWELEEERMEVSEVLVSGEGASQRLRKEPMLLSVADRSQFKGQIVSLQQMLTSASGVKAMRSGGEGYRARILVQGLDGKRVGVFVDGVPLGGSAALDLDRVPQELIERVEVYKGVVPPWLGGDGLSGAINVVTRSIPWTRLEAGYSVGSYTSHKGYALGTVHFDNPGIDLSVFAAAHYARNNYTFNSPFAPGHTIERDHDRFIAGQANVGLRFSKTYFDALGFSASYSYDYKEVQGGLMNWQSNVQHAYTRLELGELSALAKKSFFDGRLEVNLALRGSYGVGNVVDTSLWAYDFQGNRYPTAGGRGEVGMLPNFSHDRYIAVIGLLNTRYELSRLHAFHLTVAYRYNRQHPEDTLAARYSHFNVGALPNALHALVGGLTYELSLLAGALRNTLGVKAYYYHNEMSAPAQPFALTVPLRGSHEAYSWGFVEALSWRPWRPVLLKASVQLQSRLPTSDEIFGDGMTILPGYALRPERSLNANLGFVWQINSKGYPHARIEGQGFYMRIRDLIQLAMGFHFNMQHKNLLRAVGYGVEGELEVHWMHWLSTRANATFYRLENREPLDEHGGQNPLYGMRVPNVPWLFGNVTIDAHVENLFGFKNYTSLYASCQATEEFSYGWELSRRDQMKVPRKWNLDLGLYFSFLGQYHVSFAVRNLLNTEQWEEFRYPLPGRTYHAKLRYTIDFGKEKR